MLNYYEFLKISESANREEIELAFAEFKKELLKFSPGINLSEQELRSRQKEKWAAFDILLDEEKKKTYDEALERERIHSEYERKNKFIASEGENKSANKANLIFLIIVAGLFGLYFLVSKIIEQPDKPAKWYSHYITDDVKVLLPAKIDTITHILPPYLLYSIKKAASYKSELPNGFCITMAVVYMEDHFRISFKDLAYMTSMEEQSPKVRNKQDSELINTTLGNYRVSIDKGTYQYENIIRASENYTMLSGTTGIKIIVNYNPGDELQVKYSEIVYKSLMR